MYDLDDWKWQDSNFIECATKPKLVEMLLCAI